LGNAYLSSKDQENAGNQYSALIQLRESLNDPGSLIYTLAQVGQDYLTLDSPTKAIEYYESALQIAKRTNDRSATALLLYSIGYAHAFVGSASIALPFYDQARQIQHQDGDRLSEARTLNAMGGAHNMLGDQASALGFFEQAIPVFRGLEDRYRAAIMKNNVGLAYDDLGDWDQARRYYLEAISDYKSLLNNDLTSCRSGASNQTLQICTSFANTQDNLGELHNSTGDPEGALRLFATTLPIREVVKQARRLGSTLSRICYSNVLLGRTSEAIPNCEKALELSTSVEDNVTSASVLTFLGMAHAKLSRTSEAFDFYSKALQLQKTKGTPRGQGIALNQIGSLHVAIKQPDKALLAFNDALTLWLTTKDEDGETITRYHIAKLERDRNNFSAAHEHIAKALQIVENRRATLNSQRLLAAYFASKQDYYDLAIEVDMSLAKAEKSDAFVERALEDSERARGRRLLDSLAEAQLIRENSRG
jgi:tetratricopeptide (TPR) repeat protein